MLYILWGEDDFSIEETLRGIKNSLGDESMLSFNTTVLEGQKLDEGQLRAVVEASPFLMEKRLVIVRGLLERFEKNRMNSNKKYATAAKIDDVSALANCISTIPESTILVLIDSIDMKSSSLKNNRLYNAIRSKARSMSFPLLKGLKLSQWIQAKVTLRGSSISQQSINLLVEYVGGNLHVMNNEIVKLSAYTGGRMIEENDVRQVVSAVQEADIFSMVDAIMNRKLGVAERSLDHLLRNGVVPSQMLVMLARQLQQLIRLKDLRDQRVSLSEMQNKLGIFHEFVWNKTYHLSEKYPMERLKQMYRSLLDVDVSIKTGRLDGDLALSILVASLCADDKN